MGVVFGAPPSSSEIVVAVCACAWGWGRRIPGCRHRRVTAIELANSRRWRQWRPQRRRWDSACAKLATTTPGDEGRNLLAHPNTKTRCQNAPTSAKVNLNDLSLGLLCRVAAAAVPPHEYEYFLPAPPMIPIGQTDAAKSVNTVCLSKRVHGWAEHPVQFCDRMAVCVWYKW
jgi:hypothetical protein